MNFGTRLSQLAYGDILTTNRASYQGLDKQIYTGVAASERKLQDLFFKMSEAGVGWVIDSIDPTLDAHGNLSFDNVLNNTLYGNDWSFQERVSIYQKLCNVYNIQLVVQIDFPSVYTVENHSQFVAFVNDAISYMPWVNYWQIGYKPERKTSTGLTWADPIQYVSVLRDVYNSAKIKYPNIKILGPGVSQSLMDLVPQDQTAGQTLSNDYMHDWIHYAVNASILNYCDIFTLVAYDQDSGVNVQNFGDIVQTLSTLFQEKAGKSIPIWVIDQGETSYSGVVNGTATPTSEDTQAFLDSVELVNSYYVGLPNSGLPAVQVSTTPDFLVFIKELVDHSSIEAQFNTSLQQQSMSYGLLGLGNTPGMEYLTEKKAFLQVKFLISNLSEFNSSITTNSTINDLNMALHAYTFTNNFNNQIAMIAMSNFTMDYPINPTTPVKVVTMDGQEQTISNTQTISIGQQPTVIVASIVSEVFESFLLREMFVENVLSNLITLLPDTYNKEIRDVNYYKLLRSVAHELGTAKTAIQTLRNNIYISTAEGDALYDNFGALISLPRDLTWDDDTYRYLISGVVKALLKGPTLENMAQAIYTFTGFNAVIHELYNQSDPFVKEFNTNNNSNPRYGFVVEIVKDLAQNVDQTALMNNTNYVVGIIKPAHTLSYIVVTLNSSDDYQDYYNTNYQVTFQESDVMTDFEQQSNIRGNSFGWKAQNYMGQFTTFKSRIGGPVLIGPRYTLYDKSEITFQNFQGEYKKLSSNMPTAFRLGFSLESNYNFTLNSSPLFYADQVQQVILPDIGYSDTGLKPEDTKSISFNSINEDDYLGDEIAPVFRFNISPINTVPLTMQEPAAEEMIAEGFFVPSETHIISPDPNSWFRLNVSALKFDIPNNDFTVFSNGAIDNYLAMGPDYDEAPFETPEIEEQIGTEIAEEPMPEVIEEQDGELDLPESEINGDKFYNRDMFFKTNVSILNQSALIDRFYEIAAGPEIEFTHDIFNTPQEAEELSTEFSDSAVGNVFITNSSLTSNWMATNGGLKFEAITSGHWGQEKIDIGVEQNENDIVKINRHSGLVLNIGQLNISQMYPGDYDKFYMDIETGAEDSFPTPETQADANYSLTELEYMSIPSTSFMTNITPLASAVLGSEQRVTDYVSEMGTAVFENVDTPQTVFDTMGVDIEDSKLEAKYSTPAEYLNSSSILIYAEVKYGYLASSNSVFMTNSSSTLSTANIMHKLELSDSETDIMVAMSENPQIRPKPMFILNTAQLNDASFNPQFEDPVTGVLEVVNPDGTTTVIANYAA